MSTCSHVDCCFLDIQFERKNIKEKQMWLCGSFMGCSCLIIFILIKFKHIMTSTILRMSLSHIEDILLHSVIIFCEGGIIIKVYYYRNLHLLSIYCSNTQQPRGGGKIFKTQFTTLMRWERWGCQPLISRQQQKW